MPELSVVIPTHNPRRDHLGRTLAALREQTLEFDRWELLVIDNASREPLALSVDLSWHRTARVLREEQLSGLTPTRLRAAREVNAGLVVFSDDDTVLRPDYLQVALDRFERMPRLGVAGGRSLPEYETVPADWFVPGLAPLGCRDLGDEEQIANWTGGRQRYPECAPIGAGMVIRQEVLQKWAGLATKDPVRLALGRKGATLSSGEDNDISLVALANGWDVGYVPELSLTHLVSARRLDRKYLECLAFASSRDWVRVLALHGVCPWSPIQAWTAPIRKLKAWFAYRAWSGPADRIRWAGACGQFDGRAAINRSWSEQRGGRRSWVASGKAQ